nr:EOG090X0D84 [Macrothrix elegans]
MLKEESSSDSDDSSKDSDDELREAFEKGKLKPGLNVATSAPRTFVNNTSLAKAKLEEFTQKLDWVERLDLTTDLEPIVDDLLKDKEVQEPQYKVVTPGDKVVDDLQRETLFYRQAQSAIIEGLARLKAFGIPTKRPDDYFAQMAKSDEHMMKVKQKVLSQQLVQEKVQKVKKIRELKKYGKKVQIEVGLQRAKEKRELLAKVKEFREGKLASLDFLEETEGKKKNILDITKQKTKEKNEARRGAGHPKAKRQAKDNKFGFGGKKRGTKRNNIKKDAASKPKGNRPDMRGRSKQVGQKGKGGKKKR